MIIKTVDDFTISFLVEEPDDLLTLRRIIKNGDKVIADTTRLIKQEKDFARPDRGRAHQDPHRACCGKSST
jgi:protein pelota